jgi:hypothetical protein
VNKVNVTSYIRKVPKLGWKFSYTSECPLLYFKFTSFHVRDISVNVFVSFATKPHFYPEAPQDLLFKILTFVTNIPRK